MDCLYKNPNQPIEARIKDLLSRMTLNEKIGQIIQIERTVATSSVITNLSIGMYYTMYSNSTPYLIIFLCFPFYSRFNLSGS
jgi:beta-glucosidase